MGSSASKAARSAGSKARQYPTRVPNLTQNPGAHVAPRAQAASQGTQQTASTQSQQEVPLASSTKTEEINLDASDPTLAAHLRTIGPVRPLPHYSPSSQSPFDPQLGLPQNRRDVPPDMAAPQFPPQYPSAESNPALAILAARQKLQDAADLEFEGVGRKGSAGRTFFDAGTIRQCLVLRDEKGKSDTEIEKLLGMKEGIMAKLGAKGIVTGTKAINIGPGFGERE